MAKRKIEKLEEKPDTVSMNFCERCGTMKLRLDVVKKYLPIPYCPVCQIEIKMYFSDGGRFIHFGNWERFAKIMETLERDSAKYDVSLRRGYEKPGDTGVPYGEFVKIMRDRAQKMRIVQKGFEPKPIGKR